MGGRWPTRSGPSGCNADERTTACSLRPQSYRTDFVFEQETAEVQTHLRFLRFLLFKFLFFERFPDFPGCQAASCGASDPQNPDTESINPEEHPEDVRSPSVMKFVYVFTREPAFGSEGTAFGVL